MKKAGKKQGTVPVQQIVIDEERYPRVQLDKMAIEEYADAMRNGDELPPIVVFADDDQYFLADGRHRVEAARQISQNEITADIRQGTSRDALLHAVGANAKHGLRRSNADKRRAVELMLDDEEWRGWSNNRIAKACKVSDDLVKKVRSELYPDTDDAERKVERQGTIFNQKRGNRKKKADSKPQTPVRIASQMIALAKTARLAAPESGKQAELAKELPHVVDQLEMLIGKATDATRMIEDLTVPLTVPLNVYQWRRKGGITRTRAFEKKGLATHAVNVGLLCGHACYYCSSPSIHRTHAVFQEIEQTAYTRGIAIVDPDTSERLSNNMPKLSAADVVQLCTLDDAWSPEARRHHLGRKCLEFLLNETPAQVRVLTKSHHVEQEFDWLREFKDRVIIGLSTGTPPSRDEIAQVIEPNASSVSDRLRALQEAHKQGLRTFGMLCPVLPGIGDSREALDELFDELLKCGVEDIWLEPVNRRGTGLHNTAEALKFADYPEEAVPIDHIRNEANWSGYTKSLVEHAIDAAESKGVLDKLKILLYPSKLLPEHEEALKKFSQGIVWLRDDKPDENQTADAAAEEGEEDTETAGD